MKEFELFFKFLEAAKDATENCLYAEFECPVCGKTAQASKAECNSHVHARCTGCDMNFME